MSLKIFKVLFFSHAIIKPFVWVEHSTHTNLFFCFLLLFLLLFLFFLFISFSYSFISFTCHYFFRLLLCLFRLSSHSSCLHFTLPVLPYLLTYSSYPTFSILSSLAYPPHHNHLYPIFHSTPSTLLLPPYPLPSHYFR